MSGNPNLKPEPQVYAGVKWGLLLPTVILVAEYSPLPVDHIKIFRELYREELQVRKFFCDPAEPEFIARMRKNRLPAAAAPKEQDLARNLIKQRLANTREGRPGGLTIAKECRETIPEFQKYHMPEGKTKPLDADTHGIKALHFLVLGLSLEATPRVRWL